MATWEDVRGVVATLPDVVEGASHDGVVAWRVRDKLFAWERPLRRADRAALGDAAPDGPILAARVPDVGAKEALLADDPAVYFTTPHFDGYPAVLVRLERIGVPELTELLVEAWIDRAPLSGVEVPTALLSRAVGLCQASGATGQSGGIPHGSRATRTPPRSQQ